MGHRSPRSCLRASDDRDSRDEVARFTLAAGEEKQNELEKFFGKSESSVESRPPGQFTRAFFGLDLDKPQPPARSPAGEPDLPVAVRPDPEPPRAPGQFTRIFGAGNVDAQPQEWPAQEQPQAALQTGIPISEPGTLTDLFTAPSQVPPRPLHSQPGTFTALFQSDKPNSEPAPAPEFRQLLSSASPLSSPGLDASGGILPGISRQEKERPREDAGAGGMPFAEPNRAYDPATRIFSSPKPAIGQAPASGGPSAFTRVIASSALRAAEEKADSAVGNSALPPAVSMASIPVPASAPQSPGGNMPAQPPPPVQMAMAPVAQVAWPQVPQLPSGQMQPPLPGQMPTPPVPQVAWPLAPQLPSAQAPQPPQMQPEVQTPQQKWITYLPLIIGLNLLFFLAVILILIFGLTR